MLYFQKAGSSSISKVRWSTGQLLVGQPDQTGPELQFLELAFFFEEDCAKRVEECKKPDGKWDCAEHLIKRLQFKSSHLEELENLNKLRCIRKAIEKDAGRSLIPCWLSFHPEIHFKTTIERTLLIMDNFKF